MTKWLTLVLLSSIFIGCNSGVQTSVNNHETISQNIQNRGESTMENRQSFLVLANSSYPVSTKGDKTRTIYRSDVASDVEAFKEAYLRLTNEIATDFQGTVIIAQMGEKRTGGYKIALESVKEVGAVTEVTFISSAPTGMATMALTNPYIIVYLPDNFKEIKIIDK